MTEFIELIPVDLPPFFQGVNAASHEISQDLTELPVGTPILLKNVRRFLGNLWLPTYLPVGFDMERIEVTNTNRDHPDLIFPCNKPEDNVSGQIILTVHRSDAYGHEYVPLEHENFVVAVGIGGKRGFLIRGGWLIELNQDGAVQNAGWNDEHTRRLVLSDEHETQVITLDVIPASLMTEDELVRVGASLQISHVYRSWLPWLGRS